MDEESDTLVKEGLLRIGQLFEIERELKGLTSEERKQLEKEKPLLDSFWTWAEASIQSVMPRSKISHALNYALSNKTLLETYLQDGKCALSNNLAENSIRPFTVGRKNWLFSGSPKGASASAAVYSIIETCKANGIDPEKYLNYLFERMPNEDTLKPAEILYKYMPWDPIIQESCK